jgi:hypothetical protein
LTPVYSSASIYQDKDRIERGLAVVPNMVLDRSLDRLMYADFNGRLETVSDIHTVMAIEDMWTKEEEQVFVQEYVS